MHALNRTRTLPVTLALGTALLGSGCREPLALADLAGTYVLVAYNGGALPQAASAHVVVVGDTLRLGSDGIGTWTAVRHQYPAASSAREFEREEIRALLVRRSAGMQLEVSWACGGAECRTPALDGAPVSPVGDRLYVGRPPSVFTLQRVAP